MIRKGRPWPLAIYRNSDEEIRNICWNCENYFSVAKVHWLPKEEGQKQYLNCNHCGKVNHL